MKTNVSAYLGKVEIIRVLTKRVEELHAQMVDKVEYYGEDFTKWPEWATQEYTELSNTIEYIEEYVSKI